MWETVTSHDDEDDSSRPTTGIFKCVVNMMKPQPQEPSTRSQAPTQPEHDDPPFFPHHQPLAAGLCGTNAKLEPNETPDVSPPPPQHTELHTQEKKRSDSDDSAVKRDSSLTVSPKGVDDFDAGVVFFDDYFSSENNPFREAQEESMACSSGGWETAMITGDTPRRSNDASPFAPKELAGIDFMSPRTKDPGLDETALRLFDGAIDPPDPVTMEVKKVPALTPPAALAEFPVEKMSSSIRPNRTITSIGKVSSKMRMYIDDYDAGFFRALMYDLIYQPKIIKLDIYRSNLGPRTPSDMELFFRMVRSLPKLRILSLSNMDGDADLVYFDEALSRHASVTNITLKIVSGTFKPSTVRTLQSIPCLTDVSLDCSQSFDASPLLGSTTLRRLHITSNSSHSFDNAHVMAMIPLLEQNSTLVELDLEPNMSILAFKFIARALRVNRSIQVLQVAIDSTSSQALIHQAMSEIATVLTVNSTLRALNNINYSKLQVEGSCSRWILRGLEANVTIEYFRLFLEGPSFTSRKRELIKPSSGSLSKRFGDGSAFSSASNARSMSSTSDCSVPSSDASNVSSSTTTIFCSAFDAINLEPMARVSKSLLNFTKEQSERALSYMALGFSTGVKADKSERTF